MKSQAGCFNIFGRLSIKQCRFHRVKAGTGLVYSAVSVKYQVENAFLIKSVVQMRWAVQWSRCLSPGSDPSISSLGGMNLHLNSSARFEKEQCLFNEDSLVILLEIVFPSWIERALTPILPSTVQRERGCEEFQWLLASSKIVAKIIPCNQLSKKSLAPFRPLYLQSVRVWEDTWIEGMTESEWDGETK